MTERPVCLHPEDRLDIARALMVSCGFRHLPVEGERLLGVVSSTDLLAVDLLRETTAREAMSSPVVTAEPDTPTLSALHTLMNREISCLPVVAGGLTVGIVTISDFLRCVSELLAAAGDPSVSSLMTPRPILTVRPDDPLDLALVLIKAGHVRHLPVLAGEHLAGILSDHDLIRALGVRPAKSGIEQSRQARQLRVAEAMTSRVLTARPDQPASALGELLRKRRVGAVPVVRSGRLVGMLSTSDFFQYLLAMMPTLSTH
jgi:acetoin utilization protein AcuB